MNFLTAPLSSLGLLAVIYAFYILANLSRRYGEVIRLAPYYRVFYIGMVLVGIAFIGHVMQASVVVAEEAPSPLDADWFYLLTYYLPLALGVTIALGVTWRYWSWILQEFKE
jgi:hypothetical protein